MASWEDRSSCDVCNTGFSLTLRRHHCRSCGKCVCSNCSPSTVKMDGVSALQRICTPCASVTSRIPTLNKSYIEVGERLHSMVGARLNAPNDSYALDDTLEFCKAALTPLQCKLVEYQKKLTGAEKRASEFEARMQVAHGLAVSCGRKLYSLIGGEKTSFCLPESSVGLVRFLEFCNELLPSLVQEHEKQSATWARATRAEAAVTRGEKERVRLEGLLSEAKVFCRDACERLRSINVDIRLDIQPSKGEFSGEEHGSSKLQPGKELYCESSAKAWEEDTTHCAVCKDEFGMSTMKRRHHCRICGKCVCSTCSPSTVQLKGYTALERACTPCISNSQRAPEMRTIAVQLATRINLVCGLKAPVESQFGSLAEALAFCESALAPIENLLGDSGGSEGKAMDGEMTQLHVVEARAETLKVKKELATIATELLTVKEWSRWVRDSVATLGHQLEGNLVSRGHSSQPDANVNGIARGESNQFAFAASNPFSLAESNPFKDEGIGSGGSKLFKDERFHDGDSNSFEDEESGGGESKPFKVGKVGNGEFSSCKHEEFNNGDFNPFRDEEIGHGESYPSQDKGLDNDESNPFKDESSRFGDAESSNPFGHSDTLIHEQEQGNPFGDSDTQINEQGKGNPFSLDSE